MVTGNVQQAAAAENPAILGSTAHGATPGVNAAAHQDPDADCAVVSGSDDHIGAD